MDFDLLITFTNLAITLVKMDRFVGLVLLCLLNVVVFGAAKCPHYDEPDNGYLTCTVLGPGNKRCEPKCNKGYEFDGAAAKYYLCYFGHWWPICASDGPCRTTLPWPDCIKSGSTEDDK